MARYAYKYKGSQIVNLPSVGITTEPENPEKVYEVEEPIDHPDFEEVKKEEKKKGK